MLINIYRKIYWKWNMYITCRKQQKIHNEKRKQILLWANKHKDEYESEIQYIEKKGVKFFPYKWNTYGTLFGILNIKNDVDSEGDEYVLRDGKKLYVGAREYHQLQIEQYPESPHRYFDDDFCVNEGDVFVDVGAAEGMISLDVVEKASKVYLLECDDVWIPRLRKTFANYMDKVQIIPKYASDCCDGNNITLDELLKDVTKPIVIKMDVEGMERIVLSGAKEILNRKDVKVAICTYHKKEDAKEFEEFFKKMGFRIKFTDGYMLWVPAKEPPYLRKALMRAYK